MKAPSMNLLPKDPSRQKLVPLFAVVNRAAKEEYPHNNENYKKRTTEQKISKTASTVDNGENTIAIASSKERSRLSRPERKALERASKKQRQIRQRNGADLQNIAHNSYPLHSTTLPALTPSSTADDVMRAIKRAQNRHDGDDMNSIAQFLLHETDEVFAYGYKGSLLARLAVAALHMKNHQVATQAIQERRTEYRLSMMPMESAAIIRGLLRVHNVTDAIAMLDDELSLPLQGTALTEAGNQDRIKYRALALASISSRHFFQGEPSRAVLACQRLASLGPMVRESGLTAAEVDMPWERVLRGAAQCQIGRRAGKVESCPGIDVDLPCNVVYSVLNAMTTFPADNNDQVYELLSNALVRRVIFVTGAVTMEGCPPSDRGEAVFIGRSNVGKSSLVNMVTNRKSLAYTSKRPGKTQQFNFFAVNDKPGREKELKYGDVLPGEKDQDSFNIVDLPGFGYAKVPEELRKEWSIFMDAYIANRKTLRVLFHLVDGRHGPTDEDASIMRRIGDLLPGYATYVVVLTKADKNVKGAASNKKAGKVSSDVMDAVRQAMKQNGVGNAPVILTSAETKLGRDDIWRYLRLAAES
jgi:GTP-binding protein